jgi:chitin disaccharide deacetylase
MCFRRLVLAVILLAHVLPAAAEAPKKGRVFLTFDDGPIDVTLDVLDVLKAQNTKATFFVNAVHLDGQGGENEGRAQVALRRIVTEGHVLGNHSEDHMGHNRLPGVYSITAASAYRDVEADLLYFVPGGVRRVNESLGLLATSSNNQMMQLARLPFSNVWMFPSLDVVCHWCDVKQGPYWHPEAMANAEREVSEIGGQLAAAMYSRYKINAFGWDVHWRPSDWTLPTTNEMLPPASIIEREIVSLLDDNRYCTQSSIGTSCKSPVQENNVILLTHDFLFENGVRGRGKDANLPQLIELIKSLKAKGYTFDTLDHYLD